MVGKAHTLPNFAALSQHIDPQWIAQALAATGKASVRRRKLPAEQVLWLVIALAMYRHQSIAQIVAELDLVLPDEVNPGIASSAVPQPPPRPGQQPQAPQVGPLAPAGATPPPLRPLGGGGSHARPPPPTCWATGS